MSERLEPVHAERFVEWIMTSVVSDARGDRVSELDVPPSGRFWLGRLAPEESVKASDLGERGERLDPCAVGIRVRPTELDGRRVACRASFVVWRRVSTRGNGDESKWVKSPRCEVSLTVPTPKTWGKTVVAGAEDFETTLRAIGASGMSARICAEVERGRLGPELVISLVNTSPKELGDLDTNLYEVELEVDTGPVDPFILEDLPDGFRYNRKVWAFGINAGVVQLSDTRFVTTDYALSDQKRPQYWDAECGPKPDLSFETLSRDPIPPLELLVRALKEWGARNWAPHFLDSLAKEQEWTPEMRAHASEEAERFNVEVARIENGLELLRQVEPLRKAFQLANRSFARAVSVRHTEWRPFQIGFLLGNLSAIHNTYRDDESGIVDTLWFATGGGKTETYLLYILTAAFYDRLTGKKEGITAWVRFPLRMLSLQQTQRFADVLAAAELVRRDVNIQGDAFSLGFFVGDNNTPNNIRPVSGQRGSRKDFDPRDPEWAKQYQVLIRCPFCGSEHLRMHFNEARWTLEHRCGNGDCEYGGKALPFYIVDSEIYRFLPTVVIGTLDKLANISIQAAMRGFFAAPFGKCPREGHGFVYAYRADSPNGCLFPGCNAKPIPLRQAYERYSPSIRLQDELHLLRDSLGAVSAHYEALLDHLQSQFGRRAKVLASSATLAGFERQARTLYNRTGRIFPVQGPKARHSFWAQDGQQLMRRFVGLAPRGATLEYATDRIVETFLNCLERSVREPRLVASEARVPEEELPRLVRFYGVGVVYGATLKDVEAAARSFESQAHWVGSATLTGRTPFEVVRTTLSRLSEPEEDFFDRIHLIAASSMLSHGVDIDRLNVMTMLGLPLSTAEFIQATSRVGRTYPGLVFVLHKMARERDAAIFRIFPVFIQHGDRLIDPIPITSRSRRVLELTFPGLVSARIYGVHEPTALSRNLKPLTLPSRVKTAFETLGIDVDGEFEALVDLLGLDSALDELLREDLKGYLKEFFRNLRDPASSAEWVSDLFGSRRPMLSLRDVETQVRVNLGDDG